MVGWGSMQITYLALWLPLARRLSVFSWGSKESPRHEMLVGVDVFREMPLAMRDGMEIFLSPETLGWGEGLEYLLNLFSYNQLALDHLKEEARLICSSPMTGWASLGAWPPREKGFH